MGMDVPSDLEGEDILYENRCKGAHMCLFYPLSVKRHQDKSPFAFIE